MTMTFGKKAVGLTFNPSGDPDVTLIKQGFADLIDFYNDKRASPQCTPEQRRLYSIAITEAQTSQMWGVKAVTWKD